MKKAIMAKKIGMTQIFTEDGRLIPVTVLEAGPCSVVQKKTMENDGYEAIQVGFLDQREKLANKPKKGHFEKAGVSVKKYLKEFRLEDAANYEIGAEIKADIFATGDRVDVSGVSKGKGYASTIKRYNAQRGPMGPLCALYLFIVLAYPLPLETPLTSTLSPVANMSALISAPIS